MEFNEIYFYTSTILDGKPLLKADKYKDIVISSLQHLVFLAKIRVFGYVIMPNHVHLIWELLEFNGAEYPHITLLNSTSKQFLSLLKSENPDELENYTQESQLYPPQFWQKEPSSIQIYGPEIINQKLEYVHNNPIIDNWKLANKPCEYLYSSALYYESGLDKFGILTHIEDRF